MDDMTMAFKLLLSAKYPEIFDGKEREPLHPIHQELLDYVNSPEYLKLIIEEQKNINRGK